MWVKVTTLSFQCRDKLNFTTMPENVPIYYARIMLDACIWGSICVKTINNPPNINGVLHLQMQCSIYKCSAPYIYGALHIYMEHCIWSTPYIYGALHLYMEHSIYIWSTAFVNGALHLYLEDYL